MYIYTFTSNICTFIHLPVTYVHLYIYLDSNKTITIQQEYRSTCITNLYQCLVWINNKIGLMLVVCWINDSECLL